MADPAERSRIVRRILDALPEWFGIEASKAEYELKAASETVFTAFDINEPIGFVALKRNNAFTAEIDSMGVLEGYHRQGIGKALFAAAEAWARAEGFSFLEVKTLDESREDEGYRRTRLFYQGRGFCPLEKNTIMWGEENPCLIMVKCISHRRQS